MELFSEVYGCYFNVVSRLLERAREGMSRAEIEKLVESEGFLDSAFHLLPSLFSSEWALLEQRDGLYFPKLSSENIKRPLTLLEKSWLRAMLDDRRIALFLEEDMLKVLRESLYDVEPLFLPSDFNAYDISRDGDDYKDGNYREIFRRILAACKEGRMLRIKYESGGSRSFRQYYPYKISFCAKDDKFRLLCLAYNKKQQRLIKVILNLSRISELVELEECFANREVFEAVYRERNENEPLVIEIKDERNAPERFMLQFSSYEKQTEYDKKRDLYICRVYFDPNDETELLIRILGFGPVIKVLSPSGFVKQLRERVTRQLLLNNKYV